MYLQPKNVFKNNFWTLPQFGFYKSWMLRCASVYFVYIFLQRSTCRNSENKVRMWLVCMPALLSAFRVVYIATLISRVLHCSMPNRHAYCVMFNKKKIKMRFAIRWLNYILMGRKDWLSNCLGLWLLPARSQQVFSIFPFIKFLSGKREHRRKYAAF